MAAPNSPLIRPLSSARGERGLHERVAALGAQVEDDALVAASADETGRVEQGEAALLLGIEIARRQQARMWELRTVTSLARRWIGNSFYLEPIQVWSRLEDGLLNRQFERDS